MIPSNEAIARVQLTKDEERALVKLEAVVDGMIRDKFDGVPMVMQFADQVSQKVAWALQRKFEAGGWKCSVSPGAKLTVQLTPQLAAVMVGPVPSGAPKSLPPIASAPPVQTLFRGELTLAGSTPYRRLLVRMPTRGRPQQALEVLQRYRDMAGIPVKLEVVIDRDDETMMAAEVLQRLCALGCVITVGEHKSKIEAVNGGRQDLQWDILVLASDDMWPIADGWANHVIAAMDKHFPHLDGAVYFNDLHHDEQMCTLPFIGRRWWEQQGQLVYSPEYKSLCCDVEQTELWRARGRLAYIDEKIIEHRHRLFGKADNDDTYKRNDALWDADQAVFDRRKTTARPHAQWGFDQPPLWLSVLVCTIPQRKAQLEHLLDYMWSQILRLPEPMSVEILVDGGDGTTGVKHQRLIERAKGHAVAFVDDDDWIADNYFERVVGLLEKNPDADCLSLRGVMTTAGAAPEPFYHSMEITPDEWGEVGGIHQRGPNHLNPHRRELALKTGFSDVHYVDDVDYGKRLHKLLKKEVSTGDDWLYLYFYAPQK